MRIYDVSLPLRAGMVVFPHDPPFERELFRSMARGDSSDVSLLRFGAHTGTHVDAPSHMSPGGTTVDDLPLDALIGPAVVVEMAEAAVIDVLHLSALPSPCPPRVLFKTRNSALWQAGGEFRTDFVALTGEAAEGLVRRGVRLVGVDYLSVDRYRSGTHPAHLALMQAGAVIIEGLDLAAVPPGRYDLVCAPLRIARGEAAPARAFLLSRTV
jgi:arylformamidase